MQATQKIEGYDSFEQIALGGMATVYKARKVSLDKPVAIKVLFPHLAQDAVYIERFKREAQTAARVQHDNIVNVIDYGESEGSHYIVMEYYDGVTLEDLLGAHPAIPLDICFAVVLNVCFGLEAAHAAKLVHRDIKPANVIFTRNGGVKVADFGLAKAVDTLKSVTQHGKLIGTPAYMSPEQTRGDEIGSQSDIFSLGVVAYEFACNSRPFEGRNYAEVVDNIQSFHPTPITEINPLVEAPFVEIIDGMLAKSLETRYQHVSEVVIDLEEAIDQARYRRDRRTLGSYMADPGGYLASFNRSRLEELRSKPPSADGSREEIVAYLQRVCYLDPNDQKARDELARLNAKPTTEELRSADRTSRRKDDPIAGGGAGDEPDTSVIQDDAAADYRVYLDEIDLNRETPPSFALKLSMRIRSPLPHVMSIVKNVPTVIGGHLSLERAQKLARVIYELGGVARVEVHTVNEPAVGHNACRPRSDSKPGTKRRRESNRGIPPKRDPVSAPAGTSEARSDFHSKDDGQDSCSDKTVEHHPINGRKPGGGPQRTTVTRKCPKCGWEEDVDAKFCSICLFNFNKTEPLSFPGMHKPDEFENPLAAGNEDVLPAENLIDKLRGLPISVQYGGLAGLIVLLLLIIFGR